MDNIRLINNDIKNFISTLKYNEIIGEIIETKITPKHHYLTIRNDDYIIKCNSWFKIYDKLKIGNIVKITGNMNFSDKTYSLYFKINNLEIIENIGDKLNAYDELKLKLTEERMIGNVKKQLTIFPYNIGLITANNSAVIKDMMSIFHSKKFIGNLYLKNSTMQGDNCPSSIIQGIEYFNQLNYIDLIIIFRGGGSNDDLEAFNNYEMMKSIHNSNHIVYCAVGHASDTTQLINFVSDKSFGTPSIVSENIIEEQNKYYELSKNHKNNINKLLDKYEEYKDKFNNINYNEKINKFNNKIILDKINIIKNIYNKQFIKYEKYKNIFNQKIKILKPTIFKDNTEITTYAEFNNGSKRLKISFIDKDVDIYYKII